MMRWPWSKPKLEKRASGFTAEIMAARAAHIAGRRGLAELTATVQSCASLWEGGFALADVDGASLLTSRVMALAGRALALRGEALFLIGDDGLAPASDWDMTTRATKPIAYRLSLPDAGGGRTITALSAEVLHFRVGVDIASPWAGTAPLRRAPITAELLHAVEDALRETFANSPLGSQIVPFPEAPDTDLEKIGRSFRGERGKIVLRESTVVTAAGGPTPQTDWRPSDLSPDLSRSMTRETLAAARDAICAAYGVLPGLLNPATTGPLIREAQRHLAQWALQPVAATMAEEASEKFGGAVRIDLLRPLHAWDAGGRARALAGYVGALTQAKEAGLSEAETAKALALVDWKD